MADSQATGLARGWIEAWIRMDIDWLRSHLSDGFVHVSPFGRLEGRDHYLETIEPLARKSVMELRIKKVLGQGSEAVIWFENQTAEGTTQTCDWVTADQGRITEIRSFYDTAPVRRVLSESDQKQLDG